MPESDCGTEDRVSGGFIARLQPVQIRVSLKDVVLGYMDDVTKAYLAGLFDGEGSVGFFGRKASRNGRKYGKLMVRISNNCRSVLDWASTVTGSGSVHQRTPRNPRWQILYECVLAFEAARQFLWLVRPYLRIKTLDVERNLMLDARHCRRRAQ
jgi:hypothetical protein